MNKKWRIVENNRPQMHDGVHLQKENGFYSIYRFIDDRDEEGDTVYEVEEYLRRIAEQQIQTAIGASSDGEVVRWIKSHLIKEQSNALDAITGFLDTHGVGYGHEYNGYTIR